MGPAEVDSLANRKLRIVSSTVRRTTAVKGSIEKGPDMKNPIESELLQAAEASKLPSEKINQTYFKTATHTKSRSNLERIRTSGANLQSRGMHEVDYAALQAAFEGKRTSTKTARPGGLHI
jgi:hypothetical protein